MRYLLSLLRSMQDAVFNRSLPYWKVFAEIHLSLARYILLKSKDLHARRSYLLESSIAQFPELFRRCGRTGCTLLKVNVPYQRRLRLFLEEIDLGHGWINETWILELPPKSSTL